MSEASKRGSRPPNINTVLEILNRQQEIIENLVRMNRIILDLLSQHINVEEYELTLSHILDGDDLPFD